jgi:HAD superfamily hydrolase (TIGR01549 family)
MGSANATVARNHPSMTLPLEELVRDVALLCLDAGNTVIFLDHPRISAWLGEQGYSVTADALVRSEGEAKRRQEREGLLQVDWKGRQAPGALGWGGMLGTTMLGAGVPERALATLLPPLWKEHVRWNLYSRVPEGLVPALEAVRARGVPVAIISNSEGMLETLFDKLGILACFDAIFDSSRLGFEKPDRRIFDAALAKFGVVAPRALHLGDTYATDVVGARAAGVRAALIDPFGHYEGKHPDVPRVEGVVPVARAIAPA